jgi:hypothetical protein
MRNHQDVSGQVLTRAILVFVGVLVSVTGALALTAPRPIPRCAVQDDNGRTQALPCHNMACGCKAGAGGLFFCEQFCDNKNECDCVLAGTNCTDPKGRQDALICNPNRKKGVRGDCK